MASAKLLSRPQLLSWRRQMRDAARTVVHCHGCFDIVHPGHIAHLQQARSLGGDRAVLVVSVSSDANVNKGPARPLIPDDLRAASLAALECVDVVHINPDPTAVSLLADLQPDIFVKGKEYERSADPRFLAERDTVMAGGGRVVFTSGEVVYSSTALIANLERTAGLDPFESEKLARFRHRYDLTPDALAATVRAFEGRKILVVGDYIRDRYHFCDATSVASEGPMMTLRLLAQKDYDGGAAIIARHAASLGADVTLVTALPDPSRDSGVHDRLSAAGIHVTGLTSRRDIVTKHRYLCDTTKVLKVDEGSFAPADAADNDRLLALLDAATSPGGWPGATSPETAHAGVDAVIFADFGYGLLSPPLLDRLLPMLRPRAHIISADVSGRRASLMHFKNVDLLTPTERELRDAVGDSTSALPALAWSLLSLTQARSVVVTLGRQGAICFDHPPESTPEGRLRSEHIPAFTRQALDPLGCGDALLTLATLTLATGQSVQAATLIGSCAAALQATRLGNDPLSPEDLLEQINSLAHLRTPPSPLRLAS